MRLLRLLPLLLIGHFPVFAQASAPVCAACRSDVDELRRGYSADAWEKMTGGGVVTGKTHSEDPGGGLRGQVQAAAILAFDPAQVWAVLTDFEARPRFAPGAKEARIVKSEGDRVWVAQHLKVLFSDIRFQSVNTLDPEHGILSWTLDRSVPHDIEETIGTWALFPIGTRQTLVKYGAAIDSGRPVPGFVEDFLSQRSLPGLLAGVRDELRRRFP